MPFQEYLAENDILDFSWCRTAVRILNRIEGLEREYQKYNVLSTEDLTRHFFYSNYIVSYDKMV